MAQTRDKACSAFDQFVTTYSAKYPKATDGVTPPPPTVEPRASDASVAPPPVRDEVVQLEKLNQLRTRGLVTDAEYGEKRKAILDRL